MNKLKLWKSHPDWESAEAEWDRGALEAEKKQPIKKLKTLPQMPGITTETASFLKWKAFKWMVGNDTGFKILRHCLKHPFKYGWRLLCSYLKRKSYTREGDFFYYGVANEKEFTEKLKDPASLVVVGFSYCHKPFECPSQRFTPDCIHDPDHPVCRQCFIGKARHALPEEKCVPLIIPTIHYIGDEIFKIVHGHPERKVLFLITACEMTLEMFGDWGQMAGIKGIGVRLDGRICNTMKAFELSEKGIKPGLTVVTEETQKRVLNLLKFFDTKN